MVALCAGVLAPYASSDILLPLFLHKTASYGYQTKISIKPIESTTNTHQAIYSSINALRNRNAETAADTGAETAGRNAETEAETAGRNGETAGRNAEIAARNAEMRMLLEVKMDESISKRPKQ